jgi:hypothetical protein
MQQKVPTILFGLAGSSIVVQAQDEVRGKDFQKSDRSSDIKLCNMLYEYLRENPVVLHASEIILINGSV